MQLKTISLVLDKTELYELKTPVQQTCDWEFVKGAWECTWRGESELDSKSAATLKVTTSAKNCRNSLMKRLVYVLSMNVDENRERAGTPLQQTQLGGRLQLY